MTLSAVTGRVVLACSRIRVASRFSSVILADLAMLGFAISLLTMACVALPGLFLPFFCSMNAS